MHCPFCIRVRMSFGYLQIPYSSKIVPYDDEMTPINLTGKKMLPIVADEGKAINESLDIIQIYDKENILNSRPVREDQSFSSFLDALGKPLHSLTMPSFIYLPEFSPQARSYFQKKKEEKRGLFVDLLKNRHIYENQIEILLKEVESSLLKGYFKTDRLDLYDILLASHLWGLYQVPEFQFSETIHHYLQKIKKECDFNYLQDYKLWY